MLRKTWSARPTLMRHYQPQRIIEIGSGFSSAVMLDTNEIWGGNRLALTFVDPYPERLLSLMNEDDKSRHEIIMNSIQNVSLERFDALRLTICSLSILPTSQRSAVTSPIFLQTSCRGSIKEFSCIFTTYSGPLSIPNNGSEKGEHGTNATCSEPFSNLIECSEYGSSIHIWRFTTGRASNKYFRLP